MNGGADIPGVPSPSRNTCKNTHAAVETGVQEPVPPGNKGERGGAAAETPPPLADRCVEPPSRCRQSQLAVWGRSHAAEAWPL